MRQKGLLIAGVVALVAFAAAGWMRHPSSTEAAPLATNYEGPSPIPSNNLLPPPTTSPALSTYPSNGTPYRSATSSSRYGAAPAASTTVDAYGQPVQNAAGYAPPSYTPGYGADRGTYESSNYTQTYYHRPVRVINQPVVPYSNSLVETQNTTVVEEPRTTVHREYVGGREVYSEHSYRRPRSTKKSVALVAGSAGVGAAVGALAGGGKGAGIGALAGGGAGFIYDRLTHHRPPGGF